MKHSASAPGKIILSGEYAVVFGYKGIAVPALLTLTATFEEDESKDKIQVVRDDKGKTKEWDGYVRKVIQLCRHNTGGTLTVENRIPLRKGMGSSTALVIAVARALNAGAAEPRLRNIALAIEDTVNPGHSGIDFAVIWENEPVLFHKDSGPCPIFRDIGRFVQYSLLIDTGTPGETTAELVSWVKERRRRDPRVSAALETIGTCTERLLDLTKTGPVPVLRVTEKQGQALFFDIIRTHHRAQCDLGVVPPKAKTLIKKIERLGGAAKAIGAGGRTGGGGMVLAFGVRPEQIPPTFRIVLPQDTIVKSHG